MFDKHAYSSGSSSIREPTIAYQQGMRSLRSFTPYPMCVMPRAPWAAVPAGSSTGEVTLWLADAAATDAAAALTRLGTALLPDQQAALVLDLVTVSAAAAPAAAAGSGSSSFGWQLLLAAGKTMGKVSVWRSGVLDMSSAAEAGAGAGGLSRQKLAVAVSGGSSSSRQCHGMTGFVTGVLWNPWEQVVCSSGADGQVMTWSWGPQGLEVSTNRPYSHPSHNPSSCHAGCNLTCLSSVICGKLRLAGGSLCTATVLTLHSHVLGCSPRATLQRFS